MCIYVLQILNPFLKPVSMGKGLEKPLAVWKGGGDGCPDTVDECITQLPKWFINSFPSTAGCHIRSDQISRSVVSNSFVTPWTAACQGFPVHHQLPELAQTHVRQVGDTTQPSHPPSSPSPPAFNLSQHQAFFQWVSSLHQVVEGLEFQLQHQSFQ